jgi:hypothetical protein
MDTTLLLLVVRFCSFNEEEEKEKDLSKTRDGTLFPTPNGFLS